MGEYGESDRCRLDRWYINESNSFILDGLLVVDDPLLVQDPVPAVDALHVVIRPQSQLLSAFCMIAELLPQT